MAGQQTALVVHSERVTVDWDISHVTVNRDGYNTRRAIGVNGELPVPPVRVRVGDTLVLNVHNSLDVSTSIHAHGLLQRGTGYYDGPAKVTQCGIPAGYGFSYVYNIDEPGTYWLHGHDHHQNSDGLRTPLVVYDHNRPPYHYDEDILFSLEDWFMEEFEERARITLDPSFPFPPPHGFGFGLINGFNGNDTRAMYFKPGHTYRLRFVSMSALKSFKFSIPDHKLRVIEVDGVYTEPREVDALDIAPAQRYSVLVTALDTEEYNYRYNVTMYAEFTPVVQGLSPRVYQGNVIYHENAPFKTRENAVADENLAFARDIDLASLDGQNALPVDRELEYVIGNNRYTNGQHLDHINNITYAMPNIPSLYTALSMGELASDPRVYGPQTHAVILNHMEVVELTIHNPNDIPHPLHLHGHTFQVIEYGQAKSPFPIPDKFSNVQTTRFTGSVPVKRDTMSIPSYQYIKVRFRADNPGVWVMHCHLDIHFAMGMAMTFIEAPDVMQKTLRVPRDLLELCERAGIPTTGNAAGNKGFDLTGLPEPPTIAPRTQGAAGSTPGVGVGRPQ
ncbi:ferroxidase fet3 [Coemansia sp. Benny D115]|nr:ferroxidase fet3 [Coemansia sp. Benny D115]